MATFGDRVKTERQAKGWSLQDLADRVSRIGGEKCPRVTIEKIEDRGAKKSKWSLSIAAALGVDHTWLLTGRGQRQKPTGIDDRLKLLPPNISDFLERQFNAQLTVAEEDERAKKH